MNRNHEITADKYKQLQFLKQTVPNPSRDVIKDNLQVSDREAGYLDFISKNEPALREIFSNYRYESVIGNNNDMDGDYMKTVFISDLHCPYHDEKALSALKSFIRWYNPDELVFLGDVIDFYAISRFAKDPNRALMLQKEIDVTKDVIDEICETAPRAKKIFIRGNHEARLQKYLWTTAKELSGLKALELPVLLDFQKNGIIYIQDGKMQYNGIVVKHGSIVRKFAGYTAKGEYDMNGMSGISAHTHRLATYRIDNESGAYIWVESGCLCKKDAEYMEGIAPNWQQGFTIGYFKKSSERYLIETVPFVDGKAMYGGFEFQ